MTAPTSVDDMLRVHLKDIERERWHLIEEHVEVRADHAGTRTIVTYEFGLGPHAHRWMDESSYADLDRGLRREVCTRCGEQRTLPSSDTPNE